MINDIEHVFLFYLSSVFLLYVSAQISCPFLKEFMENNKDSLCAERYISCLKSWDSLSCYNLSNSVENFYNNIPMLLYLAFEARIMSVAIIVDQ